MTHLRRWGAVYLLLLLFVGSWLGHFFAQMSEFAAEQQQHDQVFTFAEFLPAFLSSTLENWQSEWLQLVFQAILLLGAKHLIFQVDAQDMERLERKVDRVMSAVGIPDQAKEGGEPGDDAAIEGEPPQQSHRNT